MAHERQAPRGPDAPSRDPFQGRILDRRYQLIERVARGGMASVYSATDLRLDRVVAVKIMHPGLGDDAEFAARFVGEARTAARLSHPNVVSVFDQGEDDGVVFLAMEMIHGHTLRDAISQKSPMSPLHAIALLEPVVAALAAAHKAGLIHRDVKPENVLIADDGRVKVADFGLAKAIESATQHTATGMLIGTVSYVAPEIVTEGRSDARGDVYAVGVILYELLTGHKPHSGETPIQIAYRHVHHDVPAPSATVPHLPAYVDALVARATARDPELRPTDARVLKHQFDQVRQALATGVTDDPRLVADLMPRRATLMLDTEEIPPPVPPADPPSSATAVRRTRTPPPPPAVAPVATVAEESDDLWEHSALEALFGPREPAAFASSADGHEPTTHLSQPPRPTRHTGPTATAASPRVQARTAPAPAAEPTRTAEQRTRPTKQAQERAGQRPLPPPGPPAAQRGSDRSDGPRRPRRSRRGPILLVLALLVACAVGAGAWWFGYARYTTTPGVLGLSQADAEQRLESSGLAVAVGERSYSDTVAEGAVISSDPAPGDRTLDGGTVEIVLSLGVEEYDVPVLKNLTEDQAQDKLAATKLSFGASSEAFSEKVAAGTVISSDPKAGTTVRPGAAVNLVLSKGPEPIKVGNWVGKTSATATKMLTRRGLVPDTGTLEYSDSVPEGRVIRQDPPATETRFRGDTVTLVVSRGPELVTVPDGLIASGVDAATAALAAAGLQAAVINSDQYLGLGYVLSISPSSGDRVPKGSTVTLSLI